MPLSRRDFLKRSGMVALIGAPIPGQSISAKPSNHEVWQPPEATGRTFSATRVYAESSDSSAVIGQLPPDSIIPITPIDDRWYATDAGYILREATQPILPYSRPIDTAGIDFWAEVVAPSSIVREWCDGAAPMVMRLGFGAMMYVQDRLVDDRGQVWYGLTTVPRGLLMGWASALQYQRWTEDEKSPAASITVAVDAGNMQVYDDDRLIANLPVYGPELSIPRVEIRGSRILGVGRGQGRHGSPWPMFLDTGQLVHGAYWHNQFGVVSDDPDTQIELPVLAARWLYGLVGK